MSFPGIYAPIGHKTNLKLYHKAQNDASTILSKIKNIRFMKAVDEKSDNVV